MSIATKVNKVKRDFTQVCNTWILDKRISDPAYRLLSYIQSKPDNRKYYKSVVKKELGRWEDKYLNSMRLTKALGYLRHYRVFDDKGKIVERAIDIYDIAIPPDPKAVEVVEEKPNGTPPPPPKKPKKEEIKTDKTVAKKIEDKDKTTNRETHIVGNPLGGKPPVYNNTDSTNTNYSNTTTKVVEPTAQNSTPNPLEVLYKKNKGEIIEAKTNQSEEKKIVITGDANKKLEVVKKWQENIEVTETIKKLKEILESMGMIYKSQTIKLANGNKVTERMSIASMLNSKSFKGALKMLDKWYLEYIEALVREGVKDPYYASKLCSGTGLAKERQNIHNKYMGEYFKKAKNTLMSNKSR